MKSKTAGIKKAIATTKRYTASNESKTSGHKLDHIGKIEPMPIKMQAITAPYQAHFRPRNNLHDNINNKAIVATEMMFDAATK